jgi:ribose transport system substrate-binding protein
MRQTPTLWPYSRQGMGAQLGEKIADILQGKVPVPTKTQVFNMGNQTEWNSKNAAEWKPYDKRVKYPGLQ